MPNNYYAFIVGVNQDWPEQRCSHGDIGLARCLVGKHVQLPKENLAEVYDERATRSNVLLSLERLLDQRRRNKEKLLPRRPNSSKIEKDGESEADTLLFYYGGHGKPTEFCTRRQTVKNGEMHTEPWIKHSDIIDLLERKFKGGTVWCIIDCCHSGGFGQAVVKKYRDATTPLSVSYGCIMSVPPADEAGLEWTMTECLIRAFSGELRCSPDKKNTYFLSTKNGKHPIKNKVASNGDTTKTNISCSHPTWEQVTEYLADEMARIKGNRLTTLFIGKGMEDGQLLKRPCIFHESWTDLTCSSVSIPRDETWMDPFRRKHYAVNDGVFVKYVDNCESKNDDKDAIPAARLGWYPGHIISINQPNHSTVINPALDGDHNITACIELYDVIFQSRWTVVLPLYTNPSPSNSGTVLGGLPFGFGLDPLLTATIISRMAKQLAYYDTAAFPPGVHVKALWKDGKFYNATTLCYQDVNWEEVDVDSSIGPCVPLQWNDDRSISFVPTAVCRAKPTKGSTMNSSRKKKVSSAEITPNPSGIGVTPIDVMMTSLSLEGKSLNGSAPILGRSRVEEDAISWEAFDAEDCEWLPVTLMNKMTFLELPLKVLAFHMCYREAGAFSVVYWESDSSLSVVPNTYLRQRVLSDDDSDKDSCDNEIESTDYDDVNRYIAKTYSSPLTLPTSSQTILHLGSLAIVFFGLGIFVGFKSKR